MSPDEISDALGAFLAVAVGREALEVHDLRRLSGGASRETWSFELFDALDGSSERLILQRVRAGALSGTFSMEAEARLLGAARDAGVPVARVIAASDDAQVIGAPFLVMAWVEGETIGRRILRDDEFAAARRVLVGQCAAALAAIHRIPVDVARHLRADDPVRQLRGLIDVLGQPHPAFELGLRWLDHHRPTAVEPRVVHGDFRLGNLMVGPDGLRAALDWELAHLGDPIEDLGWLCVRAWRFGADLPVAGVGDYDELLAAYGSAAGTAVDPGALRWWQALGTLRWGVICILQASNHLSGASRSVELAAIGRRVCENEYDLLTLIGAAPDDPLRLAEARVSAEGRADDAAARVDLHGAPSAAELVEAVREFLEGDVMSATEGRVQFHARVAGRVLAMVERELATPRPVRDDQAARLRDLGFAGYTELAAAIRSGGLDDRLDRVRASVWRDVVDKVRVANPDYLLAVDRAEPG